MSLMRWDPFTELSTVRQYMNRLFEGPFFRNWREMGTSGPRIDVYQTDTEVVATAELPGVESKEDIDVLLTDDSLTIKGEFKRGQEQKEENFIHSERYYGVFNRTIPLPAEVKPDQARASYNNGLLEIHIPKSEENKKKQVRVSIH